MNEHISYVGLDAHQETIHAAVLLPGAAKALEDTFPNTPEGIRRFVRRLRRRAPGEVVCAYEAGPLGYGLMRELEELGVGCVVVAPGLIPVKPGDRIKTDRRDARKLAELLRGGLLTMVHAPTPEQEAVRDLCRAREAVKRDQTRVRHRLSKLLLRRGVRWMRGRPWTRAHLEWLRGRRFEHAADQAILDDHLLALEQLESRRGAGREAQDLRPGGALRRARGLAALLPGHRHADGAFGGGGDPRLAPLRLPARADGVRRDGAERALQRRQGTSRGDHSSGQRSRAAPAGRGGLALPPSSGRGLRPARSAPGPAAAGDRDRRSGAAPAACALPAAARPRQGAQPGDGGRGTRARGLPVGRARSPSPRDDLSQEARHRHPHRGGLKRGRQRRPGTARRNARPGYATGGLRPSGPAILDGAYLPTQHGHAALPHRGNPRISE